ncbi:hypothetical protein HZS55_11385 [Halosimplex rubrum]|uniref:Uncharacterized protein n=1 Tax=Halosimplex rubrum TaxID=869889 RepID=A0A7D5P097_9EURY|nr:hypothetical protein [Halosimplex rubrum]QLH77863.1 hypothetical protein HZS55_11385 [Halosimplex rubrum]
MAQANADWRLYVEENVIVADFPAGMETTESVFAAVNEEFERLASQESVDTHVSVMGMDAPLNSDVFEKAQAAAAAGTEFGITTWVLVSDGIKNRALQSKVGNIEGVETELASSVDEAMDLAGR